MPEDDLKQIDSFCERRQYEPGQAVFLQGDPADEMFLLKAGRIKLSKVLADGKEVILDFRRAGDILGENMLTGEMSYPVSAWAMEDTFICRFGRYRFEQLILEYPKIGFRIIQNMSVKMVSLTDRLGNVRVGSLEDRVYEILKNVAQEHFRETAHGMAIEFPLTHEELSFLIGAHRVSVTKAMKTLVASGKIIKQGRTLILP